MEDWFVVICQVIEQKVIHLYVEHLVNQALAWEVRQGLSKDPALLWNS